MRNFGGCDTFFVWCLRFELHTLHILYIVLINWAKLMETWRLWFAITGFCKGDCGFCKGGCDLLFLFHLPNIWKCQQVELKFWMEHLSIMLPLCGC